MNVPIKGTLDRHYTLQHGPAILCGRQFNATLPTLLHFSAIPGHTQKKKRWSKNTSLSIAWSLNLTVFSIKNKLVGKRSLYACNDSSRVVNVPYKWDAWNLLRAPRLTIPPMVPKCFVRSMTRMTGRNTGNSLNLGQSSTVRLYLKK